MRLVEQVLLAVQLEQFDHILARRRVELATIDARIDEGAQTHMSQGARLAGGDIAVQVGDDALWQVVGLQLVGLRQPTECRHQPPVAANHALDQSGLGQVIEAALTAVTLPGGVDQRHPARVAMLKIVLLNRGQQGFRHTNADEAAGGDGAAIIDQPGGRAGADDLVS